MMKAVVLAAGYATRLYPLTKNFPKPLLEVQGKSILDHLLEDIDTIDEVTEHIIISNHRFAQHFEDWKKTTSLRRPITILDDGSTDNETRLGAVRDMQFAIDALKLDDDLLVVAGDNLVDFSFQLFVDYFHQVKSSCVMCHYEEDLAELRRCGVMIPSADFRVLSMEEKPSEPKSNWCVGPFYIYKREDLGYVARGIADGCGVDAPGSFICYLCEQVPVYAMKTPGKRFDIGDLASYESVKRDYRGRK